MVALATRENMNADGGGAGETMMLGGTGKYADITGSCAYTVSILPDNWKTTKITFDWNTPPVMERFQKSNYAGVCAGQVLGWRAGNPQVPMMLRH